MNLLTALCLVGNVLIVLGLWYQGNKVWWAYLFSIAGEVCWIGYALTLSLHPAWVRPSSFLALAFISSVFAALAARNLLTWRRTG